METEDQQQQKEKEKQKVSRYKVPYRGVSQGRQKLYIPGSDGEIRNILHVLRIREYGQYQYPFTMKMYRDPTQSARSVVFGLNRPYGIAFNSRGEMIVSEHWGHQIAIVDTRYHQITYCHIGGQRIRTFGSCGDSPEQMIFPAGIAIDDMDNIYVTSKHKLQKFTSSGELIKCVGQEGSKEGEFDDPLGLALHNNQVYVCDQNNHRIQVFDLDLNFIQSIGSYGRGKGELAEPHDVKFDTYGNMYIADCGNKRVQVLDRSGHFIRVFGEEGKGKLSGPTALHIVDIVKYVYVSDGYRKGLVYNPSGQFVTSFGMKSWHCTHAGITSCADGFIYVCDSYGNQVNIF